MPQTRDPIQFRITAGPTKERPLTLAMRTRPDEDGQRAGLESDLTVVEARAMAHDLMQACEWVESGVWKPGVKP